MRGALVLEVLTLNLGDLDATVEQQREAAIALGISMLLLEDDRAAGDRLCAALGGSFACSSLNRWQIGLEENGNPELRGRLPDAALYAETKRRQAENSSGFARRRKSIGECSSSRALRRLFRLPRPEALILPS